MSTYKPGQQWQQQANENTWLKLRVQELENEVQELQREVETLHQEIRDMQATAEFDILDEE